MRGIASIALVLVACSASCIGSAETIPLAAKRCEELTGIAMPHAIVRSSELVPQGGSPRLPQASDLASTYKLVPSFCRVEIRDQPSADSDVEIEVWLPANGWNGRLRGLGNGGFAGLIDYRSMAAIVNDGFVAAGTDTGHVASGPHPGAFALGHPERIIDYGWRGIHDMTVDAKLITEAFYGKRPDYSYFASCSNGGRQALMEAQRFPEDYDGILAGDPANYWTHMVAAIMWDAQATTLTPDNYIPASKIPSIQAAVLKACDADDGVVDGVISDPRTCKFDPASMLCKEKDSDTCLLPGQVDTLKKIMEGPRDAAGRQIFPGYLPGAEEGPYGLELWITGTGPSTGMFFLLGGDYFKYFVYEKPDWDYRTYHVQEAVKLADRRSAANLNATDSNLKPFAARGGKLILYHGWNDWGIPAENSINYYESVIQTVGKETADEFSRLYLVPGMQHCGRGPGAWDIGQDPTENSRDTEHDVFTALEAWVEKDVAPRTLIATRFVADDPAKGIQMTRPLCAYPLLLKYKGSGDPHDASSFECTTR